MHHRAAVIAWREASHYNYSWACRWQCASHQEANVPYQMTGLNPTTDSILSISCYVTDATLNLINTEGYHATISTPKAVLESMNDWCVRTHTASGLVAACLSSSAIPAPQAASELLSYVKTLVPLPRTALLAGNSVHADKMFLMKDPWTPLLEHLHYRILDISAIKEAVRRWCSDDVLKGIPKKKLAHTADEDVRESIAEARYYMALLQGCSSGVSSTS